MKMMIAVAVMVVGLASCQPQPAMAEAPINIDKMVNAIYIAEGGVNAKKPFGILSVPCTGFSDCQRICRNTVRNNIKRWEKAGEPTDYITFLGARYAPVNSDTDNGTNKYWVKNVRYYYEK